MGYSYLRRNTSRTYWGNSACKIAKGSKFQCPQIAIYALMKMVKTLIKRYTAPWLVPCFIYVHLGQISCLAVKRILRYLAQTPTLGLWYPKGSEFDLIGFSDADYAGDKVDCKSTSGTCHFLGQSLVCWSSKKQNCVSLSTAKSEYIAAGSCCAQLLWMKQTLKDYGIHLKNVPLYCDNESAIKISHNPV